MTDEDISGVHLEWPMDRADRPFVVRVVEPDSYDPGKHTAIFNAVIEYMLAPQASPIVNSLVDELDASPEPFDLVTFPEAFVSANALIEALRAMSAAGPSGCIHVGLRPNDDVATHLFSCQEIDRLVGEILALKSVVESDLETFREWLGHQKPKHSFNLGAVFAVDSDRRVRICLHPKQVRSQFEVAALPEKHMSEADLLSVITLYPSNRMLRSVTLQPVICSDLLRLSRDRSGVPPVHGVNRHPDKLLARAPDHVDVVSVVACTPQPATRMGDKLVVRWQEKFLEAFKETQDGTLPRHNFATVVVANFRHLTSRKQGGLSGAFLPFATPSTTLLPEVVLTHYGRSGDASPNAWSEPQDDTTEWQKLGFVASLDPLAEPITSPVRIFAFTIHRLPRENALWDRHPHGLTNCSVHAATFDQNGDLDFKGGSEHG